MGKCYRHAAASYGHIALLDYLISKGGDINVTDEDGDTPLYTVESIETATWLVEHGARVDRVNSEGITPAQHLHEEYPEISQFLTTGTIGPNGALADENAVSTLPSEYAQQQVTDVLTEELMRSVGEVMARAEAEGRDPESELTELVQKAVLQSMLAGAGWAEDQNARAHEDREQAKRQKTNGE